MCIHVFLCASQYFWICLIQINQRNNPIAIFSTALGIIGGIHTAVLLVLPWLFKCVPHSLFVKLDKWLGYRQLPWEAGVTEVVELDLRNAHVVQETDIQGAIVSQYHALPE